jgi:hypothetical protein
VNGLESHGEPRTPPGEGEGTKTAAERLRDALTEFDRDNGYTLDGLVEPLVNALLPLMDAEVERLRAENEQLREQRDAAWRTVERLITERARLRETIQRLRDATERGHKPDDAEPYECGLCGECWPCYAIEEARATVAAVEGTEK